ncbi:MAG: 1-deoxy-D-xylulose-5-phosphate reductoisomerase, partial [Candidatus Methylumidiphilus sp.]
MGNPDMRIPIAHALGFPERIASGAEPLDLFAVGQLNFQTPDFERFPNLRLAYEAVRVGGALPAVLNAANEAAVAAFLDKRIRFTVIPDIIAHCMDRPTDGSADSIEGVLEADAQSRAMAQAYIAKRHSH